MASFSFYAKLAEQQHVKATQLFKPEKVSIRHMFQQEELNKWRRQARTSLVAVRFVDGDLDAFKLSKHGWINAKKKNTMYISLT